MIRVLVIAEHNESRLSPATLNCVGAALAIPDALTDVAVLARHGSDIAAAASLISGITRVVLLDRPENAPCLAAIWAPQVAELATAYTHVFAPATTFGKDLLPRAAAISGVGMLSDILAIDGPWRFRRPIYAGNAIVTVAANEGRTLFATVRTTAFDPPLQGEPVPIEPTELSVELPDHTRFVERRESGQSGPDLQTADAVVVGGRGIGGDQGVALIERLANALGAAIGASRAAVDAGWMANDLQVGQTGKIIAPTLYIGIGVSGAIQHLTGIKDADTIVAINKDADAPICSVADIVLIDDLFSAVPELITGLEARQAS